MKIEQDTYIGETRGLSYNIIAHRMGHMCSLKISVHGTISDGTPNPIILTLPEKYRPAVQHRLVGYGTNCEWIARPNGEILTSGVSTGLKSNNDIGFTYITLT